VPTEPNENFIPRKFDNINLKKNLELFSEKIGEAVNFGSHIFYWCLKSVTGGIEKVPLFMSFRHLFELIDAISILVKLSCIDPCKILLRASFESLLTIEYIFEENTEQRAMDFMFWYKHQELKIYKRWDPGDHLYIQFRELLKNDKVLCNWKPPEFPQIKEEMNKREKTLQRPEFSESRKEYQRLKKQKKGGPNWWFSLHGGPESIKRLANQLNRPAQYLMLYRQWSSAIHGTDIIRNKIGVDEFGRTFISQIRRPNDSQFVTLLAINFAATAIRKFVEHFIPHKRDELEKWHKNEIKDFAMSLGKKDLIIVE